MRISIVTLALDFPRYLDEALGGVSAEGSFELEHVIVHDGDETSYRSLVERYPHIRVIRGTGAGSTAAAAQGIEAATGDFILFLHSDDRLGREALGALAKAAAAQPDIRIWSGGLRIFAVMPDNSEVTVRQLLNWGDVRMTLENVCDNIPMLTARFVHRSVYEQLGNINPHYPESNDREFLLRAVIAKVPEGSLDVLVSDMRMHGESRTLHRRTNWVPPYLSEHVRMADAWLAGPALDPHMRRFLWNWRARESLRLMIYQCRSGMFKEAFQLLLTSNRADPLWGLRMLTVLAAIRRRQRTNAG